MKTKLMKRSLCIVLVAVMLLGLSVINASACSHSSYYWEWNHATWFNYYQLNEFEHDVCEQDVALCKLCDDENIYCTHWYSQDHSMTSEFLYNYFYDFINDVYLSVWKFTCTKCHYSYLAYEI